MVACLEIVFSQITSLLRFAGELVPHPLIQQTGHTDKLQCDPLSVNVLLQIKPIFQLQSLYQPIPPAPAAEDLPVPEIFGSIH